MIRITEVKDRKDLKDFVLFPFRLYRSSRFWVPPLIEGEMKTFDPQHNPTLAFCRTQLITARDEQGRIVGRLALIVNCRENDLLSQRKLRFGWLDFEDDPAITRALFDYAERWGRQQGMDYMEGPVGFCNLDKAALLTEGFDELSNTTALYNYPYYESHLLACGFEHCTRWVEKEMLVPKEVPEKIRRFSTLIRERNQLSVPDLHSKKALRRYIPQVFDILNQTYCTLENFVPLTPEQQEFYAGQFMDVIHPDYVSCVEDKDGNMIAFGVAIPYMGAALQKAGGSLWPFGWYHILKALRHNDRVELLLIGVLPKWQRKGVTALIFDQVMQKFIDNRVVYVESNPEQEQNTSVQAFWKEYKNRQHKARWTFHKRIL